MHMKMFNRMNWVVDGMNAKIQPVFVNDIALATLNCLKMEETIGQSYDLGGPHVYTYNEISNYIYSYMHTLLNVVFDACIYLYV